MQLAEYLAKSDMNASELARRIGVSRQMVSQWIHGIRQVAAERVLTIERETDGKVSRHELRPDIYPRERKR